MGAALLLLLTAPAAWIELRSPHFRVVTDAGESQARDVAFELEKIHAICETAIGPGAAPDEPVMVFASRDRKSFEALLPASWREEGGQSWAGLFIDAPSVEALLLRLDVRGGSLHRTVYHEYVHYLTRRNLGPLPPWLNEGLASYWSTVEVRGEEVFVGRPDYEYLSLLKRKALLPLETLLTANHDSPHHPSDEAMTRFYAQSWALTHFLHSSERRRSELAEYVSRLGGGRSEALQAARAAFGDLEALGEELRSYIRSRRFHGARFGRPVLEEQTLQVRTLSAPEVESARSTFQ
jgi:hypothetical protein